MKTNEFIRLLQHSAVSKIQLGCAIVCSMLNKICDIVPEILIGISIDVIVKQEHSLVAGLTGIVSPFHQLYAIGALTALLWILESIFEYWYSIAWRALAQNIQHTLRMKAYSVMQDHDMAYFENTTTGGLLHILQDDINQLEQFLSQGPNEVIQLLVNIVVMGSLFFYLSPMIALVALLPIPLILAIAYYFQHKLAALYARVQQASAGLASHMSYRLQGIATIKSYTTQQYELTLLAQQSNAYQTAHRDASCVTALYIPLVRMAVMVGFIASLILGGAYALQGIIPINWYAALVFLTQRFLWPFTTLAHLTDLYEQARASVRRILAVLEQKNSICSGTQLLPVSSVRGVIQYEHVAFAYSLSQPILRDISFTIPQKKTVAFVGSTGSGKSTILKLLLRFYDATAGKISIDGHAITDLRLDDLRASMALVSQDVYMIEGTIADNISYGCTNAVHDDIVRAAQLAHIHDFIMKLPDGYATQVQEHGKNFSGGQRQRIAIARAVLKRAPILIFDEATSAVDNETQAAIEQSLVQLQADHTIVIVAHRLSAVRHADVIYVLDAGSIVEFGTHDELFAKQGAYFKLCTSTR